MKKLILFELRKVFSKRLALIALIGIILFSALLSFSTFQNKYAFDQNIGEGTGKTAVEIDKEIAAKYKGMRISMVISSERIIRVAVLFIGFFLHVCKRKRPKVGLAFYLIVSVQLHACAFSCAGRAS